MPLVTPAGPRILELSLRVVNRDGAPAEFVGIGRDVTERKQREQALRNLTLEDELTGLYNRRGFLTLAERHLKLAVRKKHGRVPPLLRPRRAEADQRHAAGTPKATARSPRRRRPLRHSFRSADIIARLGGDEFTVFPLEAPDASADLLMSRLGEHIRAFNAEARRPSPLSISVGNRALRAGQRLDDPGPARRSRPAPLRREAAPALTPRGPHAGAAPRRPRPVSCSIQPASVKVEQQRDRVRRREHDRARRDAGVGAAGVQQRREGDAR